MKKTKDSTKFFTAYRVLFEIMNKKQKRQFFSAFFYSFMQVVETLVPVQIIGIIISKLLGEQTQILGFNVNINLGIGELLLIGIGTIVLIRIIYFFTERQIRIAAEEISNSLRETAFSWALVPRKNLDLKMSTGDVVHRVNSASNATRIMVEEFLISLVPEFLTGFFALAVVFLINWICGLILLGAMILSFLNVLWRRKREGDIRSKQEIILSNNSNYIVNILQNLSLVHLFSNQEKERLIFKDKNEKYIKIFKRFSFIWSTYWFFAALIRYGTIFSVFAIAAYSNNFISIGAIYILMNYIGQVFSPIQKLGWFIGASIQEGIALNRLKEIKPKEGDLIDLSAKNILENKALDKIELKDISVKLEDGKQIKNINITLEKNKLTVLKGASGTGKTTTLRVLCGISEKTDGKIIVNDALEVDNMFGAINRMSVVMQGEHILNRSIAENIFYSDELCEEENRKDVVEKLKISDILKREYTENKGAETANKLSGGEKKRIGVARALVKKADVYIFDEPTNELDNENANNVIELIQTLKKDAIVFVISHDSRIYSSADVLVNRAF